MNRRREYLFHDFDFHAVQERQRQDLDQAIAQAETETLRNENLDLLVDHFVRKFSIDVPELTEGAVSVTVEEAQVDTVGVISREFFGPGPHYVPGIRATYYVPYRGERDLFRCKPSTWTTVIPTAELADNELKFIFERTDQNVGATKAEFEEQLSRVKQYLGWLRENAATFNRSLPNMVREGITARKSRLAQMEQGVQSLGVPIRRTSIQTGERQTRLQHPRPEQPEERYEVALSFAGEDRAYVEAVAIDLKSAGVSVFYDAFEKANLWGKNLIDHLAEIYQRRSRYVVPSVPMIVRHLPPVKLM